MTGILLAAGHGTRIWPFAEARNKCATPVCGTPAVRWMAEHLVRAGASALVVAVGANAQSVKGALLGLSTPTTYVAGTGTEGSAAAAARALAAVEDEQVTIAYGDIVASPKSVERVVRAAREGESCAVLVARVGADEDPRDSIGVAVREGRVGEIWGHPRDRAGHAFGGIVAGPRVELLPYLEGNPGIFTRVEVGGMPPVESDLAMSLSLMLDAGVAIAAVEADACWTDLDKPWDILRANSRMVAYLAEQHPEDTIGEGCAVDDSAEIEGRIVLSPGARIGKRCVVRGPLFLGAGSSIENGAIVRGPIHVGREATVRNYCQLDGPALGDECIVGHGAEFEGVAFERAYFYHYCEICGVVGACVDIGAATVCGTLRFDDGDREHRIKGRRERPSEGANASYLGDYSRTGVNATLMPGVKVGAWSCVGPGVVLQEDLPSRKACFVRQEHAVIDWGPERYGW